MIDVYGRENRLDTWVNGTLQVVDLDKVWLDQFAYWECVVDTDVASEIATAIERILRAAADSAR